MLHRIEDGARYSGILYSCHHKDVAKRPRWVVAGTAAQGETTAQNLCSGCA